MMISLAVAVSDNDVIGKNGGIPWYVRGDQALFKQVTMGKPIVMGRLTFESFARPGSPPKLLPGRLNIIITSNSSYKVPEGGIVAGSLQHALDLGPVKNAPEVCVIGGEQLLNEALPMADKVYLTRVHTTVQGGDRFFHFDENGWKLIRSELYKKNEVPDRPYDFEFQIWERT